MALKRMVVKAGFPDAGSTIGIHSDTPGPLPPLTRNNDGVVIAEYIDFVAPPASPPPTKLEIEQRDLQPYYAAWWRWKQTRDEAIARSVVAPTVTALTNQMNAAWTSYVAAIQAWIAAS